MGPSEGAKQTRRDPKPMKVQVPPSVNFFPALRSFQSMDGYVHVFAINNVWLKFNGEGDGRLEGGTRSFLNLCSGPPCRRM